MRISTARILLAVTNTYKKKRMVDEIRTSERFNQE